LSLFAVWPSAVPLVLRSGCLSMSTEKSVREAVGSCPVCGMDSRELLFEALIDNVSFAAPGAWDLYSCANCRCGYLYPMPDARTLDLAYKNYHTHDRSSFGPEPLRRSLAAKIRRALGNGYRNWRFGTQRRPATRLGVFVTHLAPAFRHNIDLAFRHLPRPAQGARLLDVGFGDGSFLLNAQEAGWHVAGVDTDPVVVGAAQAAGLDVRRGGIESFFDQQGRFDVITLSHVIEHVPNPVEVLSTANRLLKPGGRLWLATPNIDSLGLRCFGRHWRGLEAPRHLVLFGINSMRLALARSGFRRVRYIPRADATREMVRASNEIRRKVGGGQSGIMASRAMALGLLAAARVSPSRAEFINLIAFKD
jgi:2-polyprenyl-3-methyl-5-hydroxy-6-metoxy-1,4-benzoquinol methylase